MKKILGLLLLTSISFVSCKKEGCTDVDAINYDDSANRDDGTCNFEGELVFWFDGTTAANLVQDDISSLTYYVDNKLVGSTSSNVYWNSSPSCGANGSITVSKSLGNVKNKSYEYEVRDQDGLVVWTGYENFTAGICTKLELQY